MTSSKKRNHAVLIVIACILALVLVAGATVFALLHQKLSALQDGAVFDFSYQIRSTSSETPALYGVLEKVGATQGSLSGQYAPGKLQLSFYRGNESNGSSNANPFTHVYIDQNETLYDAGQLYNYVRLAVSEASPLAAALLPSWGLGDYISQTQLASVLGVELSAVEMQDMTHFSLVLGTLKKVQPDGALDGYTYYQLPTQDATSPSLVLGLPMKELFAKTTPLHILLTIPEHQVQVQLTGSLTAAQTTVIAPTSRMSDEDVANFVQIRETLEGIWQFLQNVAQTVQ